MIRQPDPVEAAEIAAIHIKSWQAAYRHILPAEFLANLDRSRREAWWRGLLAGDFGDTRVFVYVPEEKGAQDKPPVGFASIGQARDPDGTAQTAELMAIYLLPAWWGKGIGRALLAKGIEAARQDGFRQMTLWVLAENERAINFYEKAGFRLDPPPGGVKIEQIGGRMVKEVRYRLDL